MAVDINRGTSGVYLPSEVSNEIWQETQDASVVMRLARRIDMPGPGTTIQIITGDPEAQWVGETDPKPVDQATLDNKSITPYKLAVIEPFSTEFRRDLPGLYQALASRLPGVLAKKFDSTVFFANSAPGSNFDTFAKSGDTVSAVSITGNADPSEYRGALAALSTVVSATNGQGDISAWALSPAGEIAFLSALDGNKRPLFTTSPASDGSIGAILGRPVFKANGVGATGSPSTIGFAGDWSSAVWGSVEGVQISYSDQATLDLGEATTLNLWQNNMFALRVEIEVGFRFRDKNRFVRLTAAAQGS